jgi:hypothetical protein
VLREVIEELDGDTPGEGGWAARAEHLRGLATQVHGVALELAVCAGWNAAASRTAGTENVVIGKSTEIADDLNETRHLTRSAAEKENAGNRGFLNEKSDGDG